MPTQLVNSNEQLSPSLDTLYAPITKGVTNGDSHDHNGGDGAQISYLNLSNTPIAETNANPLYRCNSPGGVSAFVGTIATLPGGATLTYNVTSGQEAAMVPNATTQLAKMRIYNTTRGTSALISDCNTGTNTLTLTANVPAGWQTGDTIDIASQTVSGGGLSWVDLEITSGPTGKTYMFVNMTITSATVGDTIRVHPFETYAGSKLDTVTAQVANVNNEIGSRLIKITSNVFSFAWTGTPTLVTCAERGYLS